MADLLKALGNVALGTGSTTIYTAPASTRTIIKTIALCNYTATDRHASLTVNGGEFVSQHLIPARDTLVLRDIGLILETGQVLAGLAEAVTAIRAIASGLEVS